MDFPELSPAEQKKMDAFSRALNNMIEKFKEKERLGLLEQEEQPSVPQNQPPKAKPTRRKNEPKC